MMKRFGILKKDCQKEKFDAAGGHGVQWIYPAALTAEIVGHPLELTAIFTDTPVSLLGREDFFYEFKVAFDERQLTFTVSPY